MSHSSVRVIAIAGLTGRISRSIAKHLLGTKTNVTIHGIVRDPAKLPDELQSNSKVKVFQATSDEKDKLKNALEGADVCICGYSSGNDVMIEGQKTLIDACIESGVRRYIASDWCLDYRDLEFGDFPMKDPQKHIAKYLDTHSDKIGGVHILNGVFYEALFLPLVGIVDVKTDTFVYFDDGEVKWDLATYDDAARFTAEVACDADAVGFFNVLSERITTKEVAEAYGRVYSVEPQLKCGGKLESLKEQAMQAYKTQPQNVAAWAFGLYMYLVQRPGLETKCKSVDTGKYPGMGKVTTIEEFMRKHNKEDLVKSGRF